MKRFWVLCVLAWLMCVPEMNGQLILDTSNSGRPFNVGVRVGVNTTNLSNNMRELVPDIHSTSADWKAGFYGGFVVDICMRNFFALQPGVFFETRANAFRHLYADDANQLMMLEGNQQSTYFQIPLLASFRFLLSDVGEWQIDFGPYFSFGVGGSEKYSKWQSGTEPSDMRYKRDYFGENGFVRDYDWGFKMGTGFLLSTRYYAGIHYEAGCRNVLKQNACSQVPVLPGLKGRNKSWTFTIGYNF